MRILLRIVVDGILILLAIASYWWLAILGAIIASFYFKKYYELILIGFIIDIFYGIPRERFFNIQYLLTILTVCLYFPIQFIKSRIRRSPW